MGLRERVLVPDASGAAACPCAPERKRYIMNKNAKGAIAVGAATLLLLGGGGTFALWNDSANVNAGNVVSGQLELTGGTTGTWYHYDEFVIEGTDADPITIATYNVVPEDELVFVTDAVTLTAEGSNLYYTFGSNVDSAAAAGLGYTVTTLGYSAVTAAPVAITLGTALPGTSAAAGVAEFDDGSGPVATGTTVWHYTSAAQDTETFNVGLRVIFDADNTDDFDSTLDLSALSFVLKQVVKA